MHLSMKTRYWLDMGCWLTLTVVLAIFAPLWASVTAGVIGTIVMMSATFTYRKFLEYLRNDSPHDHMGSLGDIMDHIHQMACELAVLSVIRSTGSIDVDVLTTALLTRADCVDDPESQVECRAMVVDVIAQLIKDERISPEGVVSEELTETLDNYDRAAAEHKARRDAEATHEHTDACNHNDKQHGLDFDIDLGIGNFKA